ncbi:MAG: choice-of-anchor Q domain-containing protein [Lysobacteraceae bacterium]
MRVPSRTGYRLVLTVGFLGLSSGQLVGATLDWPGVAPCNGTLQACIDAAADGDRINVLHDGSVGGGLNIAGKSIDLIAPVGVHPLVSGSVSASRGDGASTFRVRIEGFDVEGGRISLTHFGNGNAEFEVVRNRIHASSSAQGAGITTRNSGPGSLQVVVENNQVEAGNSHINGALIQVESAAGTLDATVIHNRINSLSDNDDGWGILLGGHGGNLTARAGFNQVYGRLGRAGIGTSEGLFSAASTVETHIYSNLVVCGGRQGHGIRATRGNGSTETDIVNNTVVTCNSGVGYAHWSGSDGGGTINGVLNSNLLAFNERGYSLNPEYFDTITRDFNLVHGNGGNQPAPSGGDITSDPMLVSILRPYLREGSPAIDSANALAPLFQAIAGLDNLDADGLRRIKGSQVDIGALEFGDEHVRHVATVANTSGNVSSLAAQPFGLHPGAMPFITPVYTGAPSYPHPHGVYWSSTFGRWSLFSQNGADVPVGGRFNAFAPTPGNGAFVHESNAGNVSGWGTSINDGFLNDNPDAFVLATQDWLGTGDGGAGIYNPHPIGVSYFAFGGPGGWLVWNVDMASGGDMPEQARFHVYTQDRSPNAFVATATPHTQTGQTLTLDHPLLNDTPCTLPQATRLFDAVATPTNFDLRYDVTINRWFILQQSGSMPLGRQFMVLIDPRQVYECRGGLFSDGFE